jgi:hypothetical protein
MIITLILTHIIIGPFMFWFLGFKTIPANRYENEKIKFLIVSKMDFLLCLLGGIFWEISLSILILVLIGEFLVLIYKKWTSLPMYNPKKQKDSNDI